MHADVALEVGDANHVRIEDSVGTEQWNLRVIRAILAKHVNRQQQDISVKLLHAPPHQTKPAERLVAGERVARRGLHIFHVAAEDGGKKPRKKLRHWAYSILLVAQHFRRNLPRRRLEKPG